MPRMSDSERLDKIASLLAATENTPHENATMVHFRDRLTHEADKILDMGTQAGPFPPKRKLVGFYLFNMVRLPIYEDQLEKMDVRDSRVFIKPDLTEEDLLLSGPTMVSPSKISL